MTMMEGAGSRLRRQRKRASALILVGSAFCLALLAAGFSGSVRINGTASGAIGLWRIVPLTSRLQVGETVFVCLPQGKVMDEGRRRGYLRPGLCPGGVGPLIKTIVAVEGQSVAVTDHLSIDGRVLAHSELLAVDGRGRVLQRDSGGMVPKGKIYLHSPFRASWDSRYFGPVSQSAVLGLAEEILTYAP